MSYKVWLLRHQMEGVIWHRVFAQRPTEEEIAAVKAELDKRHSRDCWIQRVPVEMSGDSGVMEAWDPPKPASAGAALMVASVSGSGEVT